MVIKVFISSISGNKEVSFKEKIYNFMTNEDDL
jgi:hypothetical protein